MTDTTPPATTTDPPGRRRWLLGLEPIFEGGWLHEGSRARKWDVEDELVAVAILGDVTVDLAGARSLPPVVVVKAFALGRDVDVRVADGTQVEMSGDAGSDRAPAGSSVDGRPSDTIVRIETHTVFGDVNVHVTNRTAAEPT